eukprot:scaffold20861_cov54-Phaeocystis_antarctica.AAC.6
MSRTHATHGSRRSAARARHLLHTRERHNNSTFSSQQKNQMGAARLIAWRDAALLWQRVAKLPQGHSSLDLLHCTDGPMTRPLAQLQVEEQHRGQRSLIIKERHLRTVAKPSSDARQVGYSCWGASNQGRAGGNQEQSPSGRSSRRDA